MSLSAPDQQLLNSIEVHLAGAAPELAGQLTTFTRLASGEEMPAWERLPACGQEALRAWFGRLWHTGGWYAFSRRPRHRRGLLLLWLTMTIGLIAVALVLNHGGKVA